MEIAGYRLNEPEKIDHACAPRLRGEGEAQHRRGDPRLRLGGAGRATRQDPQVGRGARASDGGGDDLLQVRDAPGGGAACRARCVRDHHRLPYPPSGEAQEARQPDELVPGAGVSGPSRARRSTWPRSPPWRRKPGARLGSTWTWIPACTGRAFSPGRRPGTSTRASRRPPG